jgi:predicted DNA-binding transcriptional regulator YafY
VRADRLVAVLLLLQTRGQVTAAEVAAELEISERTARRDLEALGVAGLPIYSQQGRNGGWRLAGGGKTDLSGLTAHEARALFLVAGPQSQATPQVKAALRKLVRALPEQFRSEAEAASGAIVVDPVGWGATGPARATPPFLEALQDAVVLGRQVRLGYVARDQAATERTVHPLGLACKATTWYLVADTDNGLRTFRVDRVTAAVPTEDAVVRPEGFDLAEVWRLVTDRMSQWDPPVTARGTAAPEVIGPLRWQFGHRLRIGPAGVDGRIEIEIGGPELHVVAAMAAGFGSAVELVDPPEVRDVLAGIGRELVGLYGEDVVH